MSSSPPPTDAWAAPAVPVATASKSGTGPKSAIRARKWSVALIVVCAVLTFAAGGSHVGEPGTPRVGLSLYVTMGSTLAAVACVLLWWRERFPVLVTSALTGLAVIVPTSALAALIALMSSTATQRGWRRWLMIVAVYVATAAALYWDLAASAPLLLSGVDGVALEQARITARWFVPALAALFVVPFVAVGFARALKIERDRAQRGSDAAARNVATLHNEVARERDRLALARELHDTLAARLSSLSLHAGALELSGNDNGAARAVRESAQGALDDLRHVVESMRGHGLAANPTNGLADLRTLVDSATAEGQDVRTHVLIDDPGSCHPDVSHTCFRIAQEGLSNARKHAAGAAVRLDIRGGPETGLTISTTNWMRAPAPQNRPGLGLQGMSERAALVGGTFQAGPTPDGAFALISWLPWQPPRLAE